MRKYFLCLAVCAFFAFSMSAATGPLLASKDIELAGVTEIDFELGAPFVALGFSIATHDYCITGGGKAEKLSLSIEGDIFANRDSGLPRLLTERRGSKLVVRLYRKGLFFFLTQGGSAHFLASIPDGFAGRVSVSSSSGPITLSGLSPAELSVESSAGPIQGSALSPGEADISASSGSIRISDLSAGKVRIDASAGSIEIGTIASTGAVSVGSSSGSIRMTAFSGPNLKIGSSSGGVEIGDVAGNLVCDASAGSIHIGVSKLSGSIDVDSSSGGVTLELPPDSAFSAKLETLAGSIRSDFMILGDASKRERDRMSGDVNGGGYPVRIDASSGSIKLVAR